ncbi:hypothetical protein Tco_0875280 [Tanacetum coccineum]|uniref:Reverse transcriptase domain-containing protein n=1 Tax=Tanacetum coccineum TaxID=301880 RepID=A0ABQ5BTW8_9ASTR
MPEDIKVPLILGRPFLSTARAKIDVYKRKITLRVGEEKIIFKSVKSASSLIKRVYMLSLRERIELDLEARLIGETLENQGDDLMPTIEEDEVIEEFRTRDKDLDTGIDDYPSYCDDDKKIHIDCAYNLKFSCMIGFEFTHANFFSLLYVNVMSKTFHNSIMKDKMFWKIWMLNRDEGIGDVIVGEPPFRGLSDIGSPGVDGPPAMPDDLYAYMVAALQALPSLDYVSGLEYPPSPDFVPEPVYPEFMPLEDEVLPAKEQPLPVAALPTADAPGYVPGLDPKEDLEEDDDEDPKEDPANYPVDRGDDGDDEDESSDDDKDDVDIEADEEEEGHLAPADSTVVALPAVDQAPFAEETKPFKTDESAATPPPHPAYRIPSLPLPLILSPLLILPRLLVSSPPLASPICLLGYRATMIRLRIEAPSTSHSLPLPLPIILSHTRSDAPSSGTPPLLPYRYLLRIALGLRYEVGESSSAPTARPPRGFRVDYGFVATMNREIMRDLERDVSYRITDTWDEMLVDMPGVPATDDIELGRRMVAFTIRVRQDIDEIYTMLDDEQSERQLMAGHLNMLYRDRRAHARTARLMKDEARMSREAWG